MCCATSVLAKAGAQSGGRVSELYIAALGTLRNGNVFCPWFSTFGPRAGAYRDGYRRGEGSGYNDFALAVQSRRLAQ
jgi:hypothetical protein